MAEARYSMDRARAIIDGREPPAPPEELRQPGRHGEPAVTIDEQRQPAYVGYPGGYSGGWFGGMGGGGLFSGLLLGSLLGGFGGWGHGGTTIINEAGEDGGGGDFGGGDFGGGDFGGGDFGGGISAAVTSAAEASSRPDSAPEHRPMGSRGTIRLMAELAVVAIIAGLLIGGTVGMVLAGCRAVRRRNEVCARHPTRPPLRWLASPERCARLHPRLRDAVVVLRQAVPAKPLRRRGDLTPLAAVANEIEMHAVALDFDLRLASRGEAQPATRSARAWPPASRRSSAAHTASRRGAGLRSGLGSNRPTRPSAASASTWTPETRHGPTSLASSVTPASAPMPERGSATSSKRSPKTGSGRWRSSPTPTTWSSAQASAVARWTDLGKEVAYLLSSREVRPDRRHVTGRVRAAAREEQRAKLSPSSASIALEFLDRQDGLVVARAAWRISPPPSAGTGPKSWCRSTSVTASASRTGTTADHRAAGWPFWTPCATPPTPGSSPMKDRRGAGFASWRSTPRPAPPTVSTSASTSTAALRVVALPRGVPRQPGRRWSDMAGFALERRSRRCSPRRPLRHHIRGFPNSDAVGPGCGGRRFVCVGDFRAGRGFARHELAG